MWTYNYSNELYHHGVRGQKWGVRRYQNPDGTLTPRGEKRLAKLQAKADKVTGEHNKTSAGSAYKQQGSGKIAKRGEDLTNEEIDAALARKRKVDEYNRAFAEPPKEKKNGGVKDWTKGAIKDAANALKGTAIEKGKQQLGKYLETKLSDMLGTKDVLDEMKKETARINAEYDLQKAKNNLKNSKFNRDNADLANEANVAQMRGQMAENKWKEYSNTKNLNDAVAKDKAKTAETKTTSESKNSSEPKKEREPSSNYDTFIRNDQSSATKPKNNYSVSTYVRRDAEAQYSRIKERYGDVIIDLSDEDFKLRHSELYHHGVKGQKWGVRRYQNADGSLTRAGRRQQRISEMYKTNDEISKRVRDPDASKMDKLKYVGNKAAQLTMRRNSRSAMMKTLKDPNKDNKSKVLSVIGHDLASSFKDNLSIGGVATAAKIGLSFVAPQLATPVSLLITTGGRVVQSGSRIYNTVKNK